MSRAERRGCESCWERAREETMDEFEDTLRNALRNSRHEESREPDQAFVARVEAGLERQDQRRLVALALAGAAALALITIMAIASGPALAALLGGLLAGDIVPPPQENLPLLTFAAPVAGLLLLAALAFPLLVRRR